LLLGWERIYSENSREYEDFRGVIYGVCAHFTLHMKKRVQISRSLREI